MRTTYLAHLIFLKSIILTTYSEEDSFSLFNFLNFPPLASRPLYPNIIISTQFSNSLYIRAWEREAKFGIHTEELGKLQFHIICNEHFERREEREEILNFIMSHIPQI